MKKLFILLIIGLFVFSSNCLAVSTIDYNASVSSPIYRDGQNVWGDGVTGNFSIGNSFQKSFGKVRIGGNISGYPITNESEARDLVDYLSLSGSIDWFEAGHLRGSLRKESFGISYSDRVFNENFSYSLENRWNFEDDTTAQRLSLGFNKEFEQRGTFSARTSWSVDNFESISNATLTASYSRSLHYSGGETINTSIIPEVFLEDRRPVSGVTINLLVDGIVEKRVKTSQGGTASFGELEPGNYTVQLVVSSLPEGFELVSDREIKINLVDNSIRKARFELNKPEIEERTTFSGSLEDE